MKRQLSPKYIHKKPYQYKNIKIYPDVHLNVVPTPTGTTTRRVELDYPDAVIGEGTVIYSNAVIYEGVKIGKNCLICSHTVIREGCTLGDNVLIANGVTINYDVTIGNRVKVMDNTHLTGGMTIEDDAFIGCLVVTSNDNTMGRHQGNVGCNPPYICEDVRIGSGANILPGVVIGKNAVVAAGAVVTKNVAHGLLVMGVPARVILG